MWSPRLLIHSWLFVSDLIWVWSNHSCPVHLAGQSENTGHWSFPTGSLAMASLCWGVWELICVEMNCDCTFWSQCQKRTPVLSISIHVTVILNTCPASSLLGTLGKSTVLLWWKTCLYKSLLGRTDFKPSIWLDRRPIWVSVGHWNSILWCLCLGPVSC